MAYTNRLVLPGASDLVTGDVLGDASFAQGVKILDGTPGGTTPAIVDSSGRQLVGGATTPADAVTAASAVLAEAFAMGYNGATWDRLRTPQIFNKNVSASANGSTALWTPTAGKKFRLMRYRIIAPGNCTFAAAALLTVDLFDAAASMGEKHTIFLPAAVVTGVLYVSPWIDLGNGILSALANNVLNANLSAVLATGAVMFDVAGTEE